MIGDIRKRENNFDGDIFEGIKLYKKYIKRKIKINDNLDKLNKLFPKGDNSKKALKLISKIKKEIENML